MVKRAVEWRPWAGARAHSAAAPRHSRDGEGSPPGLRRCREQPRASGRAAGAAGAAWAEAAASEGSGTVIHGSRAVWPCWLALMRDSTTLSAQQPQLTWSDRQGPWAGAGVARAPGRRPSWELLNRPHSHTAACYRALSGAAARFECAPPQRLGKPARRGHAARPTRVPRSAKSRAAAGPPPRVPTRPTLVRRCLQVGSYGIGGLSRASPPHRSLPLRPERLSGWSQVRSAARRLLDSQLREVRIVSSGTSKRRRFQRAAPPKKATSETGCSKTISAASLSATRRRVPGMAINSARLSSSAYQ
eukprot:scaffold6103_cov65-Phaeocystis_antarctica.AAC.2